MVSLDTRILPASHQLYPGLMARREFSIRPLLHKSAATGFFCLCASMPTLSYDSAQTHSFHRFNVLNKPANVKVQSAEPSSQSKSAAEVGEPKYLKDK